MRSVATILLILIFIGWGPALAAEVYLEPDKFIENSFQGTPPEPQFLWITDDLKQGVKNIMGDHYRLLRVRYWQSGQRTAWILEEIGKYEPITAGFIANGNELEQMKVLIYRESHGREVRHSYFTDQFKTVSLTPDNKLSQHIDGISGATLSVNALTKLGQLALYLHKHVMENQ